jgi:colicin import membrane protein
MNPFLREHVRPLIGSALLHVAIAIGVLTAAWFSVAPKIIQPAAIEAYLAPAPRAHAGAVPQQAPAPEEPVHAASPTPDPVVAEHKAADAAQAARAAKAAEVAESRRLEKVAEAKATADLAHRKAAERDAKHRADLLAMHKADAEAKHKADLEAKAASARKSAEEARVRMELSRERARVEAETRLREAREADLARQLAAEQRRIGAEDAGLKARYVADLSARITRSWNRPPTARAGIRCIIDVIQVPGGTVTDVKVGECNGDAAVVESIKGAVFRASPLPMPSDPSLFERKLHLVFNPDG